VGLIRRRERVARRIAGDFKQPLHRHRPARPDDPVFQSAGDGIEKSRRTGYPPEPVIGRAFARPGGGYDDRTHPHILATPLARVLQIIRPKKTGRREDRVRAALVTLYRVRLN
jgi:hypothetical protein